VKLDDWLTDFNTRNNDATIPTYCQSLTLALRASPFTKVILHVGGYDISNSGSRMEFHHISGYDLTVDGLYQLKPGGVATVDDLEQHRLGGTLSPELPENVTLWFANGFPAGRRAYVQLLHQMWEFRSSLWEDPNSGFVRPSDITLEEKFLRLDMEQICLLFRRTKPWGAVIGGDIQSYVIAHP